MERAGRAFEVNLQDFERLRPGNCRQAGVPRRFESALRAIERDHFSSLRTHLITPHHLIGALASSRDDVRQSSGRTDYGCLATRIRQPIFSISRTVGGTISAFRCYEIAAFRWGISRQKSLVWELVSSGAFGVIWQYSKRRAWRLSCLYHVVRKEDRRLPAPPRCVQMHLELRWESVHKPHAPVPTRADLGQNDD